MKIVSFCAANCRTDFRVGDQATLTRMVPTVSGVRARGLLAPASFLARHIPSCAKLLHQRLPHIPLLVLPFTCTGFWTGAGLWQSNLFAETIPQFEFSALSLVAQLFWMTSQGQVLPSMEKNTNVWRLRRYHLHRAVYFLYRVSFNPNWQ